MKFKETRFTESHFRGWDGLLAESDRMTCFIAPGIGGRIMSISIDGMELLFVQEEHAGETFDFRDEEDLRSAKRRLGFRLWGGDKTYIAPQSAWWEGIPPLDLDAAGFSFGVDGNTVHMLGGPCQETGLVMRRSVTVQEDSILLDQEITNGSDSPVQRGIWDVTQFLRPVTVFIKAKKESFIGYPEEGGADSLVHGLISESNGWCVVDCTRPVHFKFGLPAEDFVPTVFSSHNVGERTVIHRRDFETFPDRPYAHRGCVEIYNSPDHGYMELEAHGPLVRLTPGESFHHSQRWQFTGLQRTAGMSELLEYFENEIRQPR